MEKRFQTLWTIATGTTVCDYFYTVPDSLSLCVNSREIRKSIELTVNKDGDFDEEKINCRRLYGSDLWCRDIYVSREGGQWPPGEMYFYERVNTYEIAIFNLKQTRVYCPAESWSIDFLKIISTPYTSEISHLFYLYLNYSWIHCLQISYKCLCSHLNICETCNKK